MRITPEQKREIEYNIAKFLRHLAAEKKEQIDLIDVIDIKNFDINMRPRQVSVSPR